jgi:two-component system, OmpR family, sensor histidine kinase QseC
MSSTAPAPRQRWPSLTLRVVLTVLAAFAVVFVVLYAFIAYGALRRESGDLDRGLQQTAQALAQTLDESPSERDAIAALEFLRRITRHQARGAADEGPPPDFTAARLDGPFSYPSELAPRLQVRGLPEGVQHDPETGLRLYVAGGRHWKVAVVDRADERSRWTLRALFTELAGYMALALPIVLMPVWWSVRTALAPLRRLSHEVAQRRPEDMRPLNPAKSYRELLPLQTALNRLFERVAHGLAREKAFVNDAAHELRTPLAVMATQAHVLAMSAGQKRDGAKQRLLDAVERCSHLTQQLLRLARAEALALAPRQPVDLMNLARDVLVGFTERAAAQRSELLLAGPDSLPRASDAHAWRSIIENLVDNALRYGGGSGVLVDVRVEEAGEAVHLIVSDNGPGIAAEDRERVFERFWRGAGEQARGAGLGLSIVREAARSLGGDASVRPGAGGRGCSVFVEVR